MKRSIIITLSIIGALIIIFLMWCRYIGTKGLVLKEYLVKDNVLPASFYGTKVVHISDIHYGQITKKKEMNNLVKKINKTNPDIIVLTGDLLDKDINYTNEDIEFIINSLNSMEAKIAKFIISGNHDLVKIDDYNKIIEKINFTNLDDTYQVLYNKDYNPILVVGISTMDNNNDNTKLLEEVNSLLKDEEKNIKYSILLVHEPDIINSFDYSIFNLILAGHAHGGQVKLPLIGAITYPKNAKKYHNDFYNLKKSKMYISSGIGTSRLKLRFLNKPSFNLYRLVNK